MNQYVDLEIKRQEIRQAYVSEQWWAKVDKMSDRQVIAVYFRLKQKGRVK